VGSAIVLTILLILSVTRYLRSPLPVEPLPEPEPEPAPQAGRR
jgi:hypothetical protein